MIWIDGKSYDADPTRNVLDVALSLGFDLPYFCWHPQLGSVGACRQCAVKQYRDENDRVGRIVMACMTPAAPGTRIGIEEAEASAFRRSVIEWLMVNHPHDCPVCDEGGECHLQDMTHISGHVYRKARFKKRTFDNQDLGPLVAHEMNRCIECYRCVRYYRDFARGRDLNVFAAHDHVYFGRDASGTLESPFAGNLVEVCPTGVFTDKTLAQHYTRKWDFMTAPSVCVHCSLGCNTIPGERYGELRRVRTRYNGAVNGYFLCDRGRYGYEFVNHERRLRAPLAPHGPAQPATPLSAADAVERAAALVREPRRVIGIGSPRASLEANFALARLVGRERFYSGVPTEEARLTTLVLQILRGGRARSPGLREVESCDAVLVLGEDVTNTAPMLGLALRQAVDAAPREAAAALKIPRWQDASVRDAMAGARGPVFVATPAPTDLDELASGTFRGTPEDIARFGLAVARALDPEAPEASVLSAEERNLVEVVAGALRGARRPLVVAGTSLGSPEVVEAAANVAWALGEGREGAPQRLFYVLPECNSLGLAMLQGGSLEDAAGALGEGGADAVIVLENDLYRRAPRALVDILLSRARDLLVIDSLATDTAARASLVLPAATFAEGDGTLVNNEGRAQRFFQVFVPAGEVRESWRWLAACARAAGRDDMAWERLDDVIDALAQDFPELAPARDAAPPSTFRVAGAKIARASHRQTGRTAVEADRTVHESKPPEDPDSPLGFTMEGYAGPVPPSLLTRIWAPNWNSVQALTRFQEEIAGPLRGGDPGVRLVEPGGEGPPTYFAERPASLQRNPGELRLVPRHHVFGSDELSALSAPIAALVPEPSVSVSPADAAALALESGALVDLWLDGERVQVRARVVPRMKEGVAAVSAGLGPLRASSLPKLVRVTRP